MAPHDWSSDFLDRTLAGNRGNGGVSRSAPVCELEKIATIEVGQENGTARRFRWNYRIARALFTLGVFLVAGLCAYAAVLSLEFGGVGGHSAATMGARGNSYPAQDGSIIRVGRSPTGIRPTWGTRETAQYRRLFVRAFVGQSFCYASDLPPGPDLALLPMN
jgi:hypothetical protein